MPKCAEILSSQFYLKEMKLSFLFQQVYLFDDVYCTVLYSIVPFWRLSTVLDIILCIKNFIGLQAHSGVVPASA